MPATNFAPTFTILNSHEMNDANSSIDRDISLTLKKLCISTKFAGYNYLKSAIKLYYTNPDNYASLITKRLYPDVANIYSVKPSALEHAIRTAISGMRCTDDTKEEIIGYVSDSYTNKEFISSIVEYIRYL